MNTTAISRTPAGLLRCAQFISTVYNRIRREMRIRRAIRHLNDLPEHLLHDIGLTHSEVASVVRNGAADETRRYRFQQADWK